VRRAGIHPHHVHNPMAELGQTLERYQLESKRFRTPPATQT
jgi:hypothetical protein